MTYKFKWKCTYCKELFDTKKEGFIHFEKKNHPWGGLQRKRIEVDEK
jgi:hypothetical protein